MNAKETSEKRLRMQWDLLGPTGPSRVNSQGCERAGGGDDCNRLGDVKSSGV